MQAVAINVPWKQKNCGGGGGGEQNTCIQKLSQKLRNVRDVTVKYGIETKSSNVKKVKDKRRLKTTHARTHSRTHAHTHARTHAHARARMYARQHARMHARRQAGRPAGTQAHTTPCMFVLVWTCILIILDQGRLWKHKCSRYGFFFLTGLAGLPPSIKKQTKINQHLHTKHGKK